MTEIRDWRRNRRMWVGVLEKQTVESLAVWNRRIARQRPRDERALRMWLTAQGVTGYARSLLVMERFGYPDFVRATADQLIDRQYADRPHLRSVYDRIVAAASACGEVIVQAWKTDVSLVSPCRTFARVQPTTKARSTWDCAWKADVRVAASCPRGFTRACPSRLAWPRQPTWMPRLWRGCGKPTTRPRDRARGKV